MPRHHPRKSSIEFSRKRTKMRYFVGEVVCVTPQHQQLLDSAIQKGKSNHGAAIEAEFSTFFNNLFSSSFGTFGTALLFSQTFFSKQNNSPTVMYYNGKLHFFIMRMEKFLYKYWRNLMVLVQKIELYGIRIPCTIRINYVSSTINRSKEHAIDYQLKVMRQLQWSSKDMEKEVLVTLQV